ncbi:MAG TPA: polysaccharide deacetylase family protein [Verrucomicrobiae bacterium]|nr:polysaccharide deacetylase family protein [Verrucomicrobiae bacterium]
MALLKRLIKLLISLLVRAWDILVAGALLRLGNRPRPTCVVIYYHAIDAAQRSRFARQMDELLRLAKPIPADLAALPGDDAHCCAVTFDDGFVSVLENALPELEARNIPATFFVPTGCMGQAPGWVKPNSPARRQRVLSADRLATLKHHRLLAIGSHSVSHPDFLKLDPAQARCELEQSKAELETILGRKVGLFSFPHGKCDPARIELARAAGYECVFTINPSNVFCSAADFVQGRVAVDPADWPLEFRLKLLGAYRWLAKSEPRTAAASPSLLPLPRERAGVRGN